MHHNNDNSQTYPNNNNDNQNKYTFIVPDKILVFLDMDEGTLAFIVNGQYLGIALNDKKLFPIVSAVSGYCKISIRYIVRLYCPLSLMDLSRRVISLQIVVVVL